MNTYLYLHTYVFLWGGSGQWLLYDSLHRKQLPIPHSDTVDRIFTALLKPSSYYSVKIDRYLQDATVVDAIRLIEKYDMGGRNVCVSSEKPVILPPMLSFASKSRSGKRFELNFLREVTVHLSGECSLSCKGCESLFRQFPYCTKGRYKLDLEQLRGIRAGILENLVEKINVIINDFRDVEYYKSALQFFSATTALCMIHIHWRHATADFFDAMDSFQGNHLIKIQVDSSSATEVELRGFFDQMDAIYSRFKERIVFAFYFSAQKEYKVSRRLIKQYAIENHEFHVCADGNNADVLRDMYFLSDKELTSLCPSFKDVLANRVINRGNFGKIVVFSDGTVHLNENTKAIGKVTDSWKSIIQEAAMRKDSPWLSARSCVSKVCRSCEYRFLCPPVSNVEMFMKSSFACSSHSNEVANK